MKKIILSLSTAVLAISLQAQQVEMEATKSAYKAKNYSEAVQQAHKAEELLKSNYTIEPKDLAEFYLNAANSAKASGDMIAAAEFYAKLGKLESMPIFRAKNKETKNWEYFLNQKEAESVTSAGNYGGVREFPFNGNYMNEIRVELADEANKSADAANKAFSAQDYEIAGKEFLKAYYLSNAVGSKNELFKYYAGIAVLQTDQKKNAAIILQELIDSGFTGVQQNFYAKDKDTGRKVEFSSKQEMDAQVKLGLFTDPEVETIDVEEDLFSYTTYAWYSSENWDKAYAVLKKGLEKYPDNKSMSDLMSVVYTNSGKKSELVSNLQKKVNNGTATSNDYYNLAVILDNDTHLEEVVKNYKKAIELNPEFGDAYMNLSYAIMTPAKNYVEVMNNNQGSSSAEKKLYFENESKLKDLYLEALPYLEKAYELKSKDIRIARELYEMYKGLNMDDKFFEFKKILENNSRK
ncbi:hypothetical protein NLM59_10225 [Weeksellaceae bacterium KMM 9724]|uniref:tetratricopeptide repeat protein n=1 Tax=Profundicola chukchiensis TaxID=2961959 RepID=UPI00243DD7F5|nr:hypothetical protein [Profundicola chukchiensis]MDG4951303.1 hypothetical protein [Profundicola chukchiensis]